MHSTTRHSINREDASRSGLTWFVYVLTQVYVFQKHFCQILALVIICSIWGSMESHWPTTPEEVTCSWSWDFNLLVCAHSRGPALTPYRVTYVSWWHSKVGSLFQISIIVPNLIHSNRPIPGPANVEFSLNTAHAWWELGSGCSWYLHGINVYANKSGLFI